MKTLHLDTLLALVGAADLGLPIEPLLADLRRGRHPQLTQPEAEHVLRELADKSLAAPYGTALGTRRWRITARGEAALREENLA